MNVSIFQYEEKKMKWLKWVKWKIVGRKKLIDKRGDRWVFRLVHAATNCQPKRPVCVRIGSKLEHEQCLANCSTRNTVCTSSVGWHLAWIHSRRQRQRNELASPYLYLQMIRMIEVWLKYKNHKLVAWSIYAYLVAHFVVPSRNLAVHVEWPCDRAQCLAMDCPPYSGHSAHRNECSRASARPQLWMAACSPQIRWCTPASIELTRSLWLFSIGHRQHHHCDQK